MNHLPCPFCGEQPQPISVSKSYDQDTKGYIRCEGRDCPIAGSSMTEAEWNTRAPVVDDEEIARRREQLRNGNAAAKAEVQRRGYGLDPRIAKARKNPK